MQETIHNLSPMLPEAAVLAGGLFVGLVILLLLGRHAQHTGPVAGATETPRDVEEKDGGTALPCGGESGHAAGPDTSIALGETKQVMEVAWRAHAVWARTGLVLDLWGGRVTGAPGQLAGGPAAPQSSFPGGAGTSPPPTRHSAGRGVRERQPPFARAHRVGAQPQYSAPSPLVELFVRGEPDHVRAAVALAPDLGTSLRGVAAVLPQGGSQAVIQIRETENTSGGDPASEAGVWQMGLRARAVLAPLGRAPGTDGTTLYSEVHRGLLVLAGAGDESRHEASEVLLAATVGLLAGLPAGAVELFLAARPLSLLYALSTAPALMAAPVSPDQADLVGTLLDRALDDRRSDELRRLRVVVLDHALAALATSPVLLARLAVAVTQGPGRRIVVLASATASTDLPHQALSAFACRLLLGPCAAGTGEMIGAAVPGVQLPGPRQGEALWVDRRAGVGRLCLPLRLDATGAARTLGLSPALLELPEATTTDAPCPGRTVLVLRLLGTLSMTAPDGRLLTAGGGLRRPQAELLAFLAMRWGQRVPLEEVPLALRKVAHSTLAALAMTVSNSAANERGTVLALDDGGQISLSAETVWVDSVAFAALCRAADAAPSAGDQLALLERALALYAGDFLGQAGPPWTDAERAHLRDLYHGARCTAAGLAGAQGRPSRGAQHATRLHRMLKEHDH